jgi:hypothetical protein
MLCSISIAAGLASCGTSSDSNSATEEDKGVCEEFLSWANRSTNLLSTWLNQRDALEGTAAGFQQAMNLGESMTVTSTKAALAADAISGAGKKRFEKVESTFEVAALAIAVRGGSLGEAEVELITDAIDALTSVSEYCGVGTSEE